MKILRNICDIPVIRIGTKASENATKFCSIF